MTNRIATCVVSLPARDIGAGVSQESQPARVLAFAMRDAPDRIEKVEKPAAGLTRGQKIRRIVESAIDKMNDDQLEVLITAIEDITGCHGEGDSE